MEAQIASVESLRASDAGRGSISQRSVQSIDARPGFGKWRRIMGLSFLGTTVFLWTASNFMASTIFADNTYSKPYFVVYLNTSFFILPLLPIIAKGVRNRSRGTKGWRSAFRNQYHSLRQDDAEPETDVRPRTPTSLRSPSAEHLLGEPSDHSQVFNAQSVYSHLTVSETARLGLEFCILWFSANYFSNACLKYTTVASATILTSTSSIFTLIIGSTFGVEHFTVRRIVGVLASITGIALITLIDLSGETNDDEHRGKFPEKSAREVMIGDIMALVSAVLYGAYAVLMKKRIEDESRVNMQLFFGFVGIFNVILLWPGFLILHFAGVERAGLPPTSRVTLIVLFNAAASLISDITWAYAVLFTSPLVVTVGLSITIPLSLIGQMLLNDQTAGVWYWIGAAVIVFSFTLVNNENNKDDPVPVSAELRGDLVTR